ncbi:MAG: alpha/beta fold hydrolase [Xanthomonadales bacterium]
MPWPRSVSSLALILCLFLPSAYAAEPACVALLHGLWRTEDSMAKMQEGLVEAGFAVRNIAYDSTGKAIAELAADTVPRAVAACGGAPQIHFVTHSMGGILIRQYLSTHEIERLGRVVMLGPPNQGSEVVDFYDEFPAFEWFAGPAGLELGTGAASVPRALGPVQFDVGVIAGTQSINLILSGVVLPDADDGKVTVDATRVEGMNDHLEMPVTHVFMMRDPEVIDQVVYYLEHGRFRREVN